MNSERFKQYYSFILLGVTILWSGFSVWITYRAVSLLVATDILAAAGANVLLGALINWNGNVIQHWFRKAKPE